jgi:hypothetical protein
MKNKSSFSTTLLLFEEQDIMLKSESTITTFFIEFFGTIFNATIITKSKAHCYYEPHLKFTNSNKKIIAK